MIQNIVIKDINRVFNVYSKKDTHEFNQNRDDFGLSFCNSGKITYVHNNKKYVSDRYHAIILPKHGSYELLRQETGYFPVINFDCDGLNTNTFITFPISSPQKLIQLFEKLRISILKNNKLEAKSILYEILAKIANNDVSIEQKAIEYIYDNLEDSSLSNKDIAMYLNISETYLNKQFKKKFHSTPKEYIITARIERAISYFAETNMSMSEIAENCGYSSTYTFSRAFKNYTKKNPTKYKKDLREKMI